VRVASVATVATYVKCNLRLLAYPLHVTRRGIASPTHHRKKYEKQTETKSIK